MNIDRNLSLNSKEWDYTEQAKYYYLRPNYSPEAIDKMLGYVYAEKNNSNYSVADIGAGTGNLSIMLDERGLKVIAVEPNQAMRNIGIERTTGKNIEWKIGTGEKTALKDKSFDLVTFGSSFNTTDRNLSLKESHRILKDNGYFVCMWNNRELEKDPVQKKVEKIIKVYIPDYTHGSRREEQESLISESGFFSNVYKISAPQKVQTTTENFISAWKSVKNRFWNLDTKEGLELFETIMTDVRNELNKYDKLEITYVTKIWVAKKINKIF